MTTPDTDTLETMLARFSAAHPAEGKALRSLIDGTPELKARMVEAIDAGNLKGFTPVPKDLDDRGVRATYHAEQRVIRVPLGELAQSGNDRTIANALRCSIAHETEHAVHREALVKVADDFFAKVERISLDKPPHDYTRPIAEYLQTVRPNEARDQIAATNVMAAHVLREHPGVNRAQFCRYMYESAPQMTYLFEPVGRPPNVVYQPKSGIELGKDFRIAETPANVEAVGKHYFDKLEYRNLYGTRCIEMAARYETWAQGQTGQKVVDAYVDLKALGIDAAKTRLPAGFHDGRAPGMPQRKPDGNGRGGPDPDGYEAMPALYEQSLGALQRAGTGLDGLDPKVVAAGIAAKAQDDGFHRIDLVLPSRDGKGLIAVEGDPASAHAKTSYVDAAMVASRSLEANLSQLRQREAEPVMERTVQVASASIGAR
jgi:hypothetical protein